MDPGYQIEFAQLRESEFSRLDSLGQAYLDYTGGGLYAESQVTKHLEYLKRNVPGNPHSHNPSSERNAIVIDETRKKVLRFFNAEENEYSVIFTSNAIGGLKLVGESYPFQPKSIYVLTADNHNSVNGIREFASRKGAEVVYIPLDENLRVECVEAHLKETDGPSLFAYPAQSNFSGVQHQLEWIEAAHSKGYDVILDAAAYAPTSGLDLGIIRPDFVPVSFYKMFGYPTGTGALIVRKGALEKLERPWFSGGTIDLVTTKFVSHIMSSGTARFEDGTPDYLGIPAVGIGLDFLAGVGVNKIHAHVISLTSLLLSELEGLEYGNGKPLVRIYGPKGVDARGGTVAFNVTTPSGNVVDPRVVGERALRNNVSIRTGCFCNPGAVEYALNYAPDREKNCYDRLTPSRFVTEDYVECMDADSSGAVRASLGIASNERDVERLVEVIGSFKGLVPTEAEQTLLPPLRC